MSGLSYSDLLSLRSQDPTNESRGNFSLQQNLTTGLGGFRRVSLRGYAGDSYAINGALATLWTQAVTTRQDYYMSSAELRRFYLVDAMISLIADDILNPDENGDIVILKSEDPEIQEELKKFQRRFDFNQLLKDITRDFIDFGEYTLRMEVKEGEGVIGIFDDVNQLNVVAFYEDGSPKRYLLWDNNDFQIEAAHKYAHFVCGNDKLRVRLEVLMNSQTSMGPQATYGSPALPVPYTSTNKQIQDSPAFQDLPDYIRIGKPIFYGIIPKLRELQLLEQLIPAAKLNQVTQSQLVAVKIPPAAPPDEVREICHHFEELLNPQTGVNMEQLQLTLAEVMNATSKIKIIPQFMDEKGALERLDVRGNQSVDDLLQSIQDIRKVILTSIGIPPTLLFGPDSDGTGERNKAQEIHLQSRYTRRLSNLQYALKQGIKQIVFAHLVNKKMKVVKTDLDVIFTNTMTDLAGLEKLEFDDTKQAIVLNLVNLVTTTLGNQLLASAIDRRKLITWVKHEFDVLTDGQSIFQDPEKLQFGMELPGGEGGGGQMPLTGDIGGTGMGSNNGVPLPSGVETPPAGGAEGGGPPMGARQGSPAPGSGKVNISST